MNEYNEILKKWQSYEISTVDDLDVYLDNFRVLFAYNSNHIENPNTTYHDTREIFENDSVTAYTGDLRTLFEIQNQKYCYEFLKEKIINKEPITIDLIKQTHKKLMKGCYDKSKYSKGERPGEFKKHLFVVGDDVGALPEEVGEEIRFILNEMYSYEGKDPLTVASYFHLSFESIHPFADGNGRLGRTLMNYYLITHNYPPTIIYSEDKETYYMALAVFDKTDNLDRFIKFVKEQTVKTWTKKSHIRRALNDNYAYDRITKDEADYLISNNIKFDGNIESDKINIIRFSADDKQKVDEVLNSFRTHQKRKR